MTLMFYFCAYMTVVYMPFDIFLKPVADDQEVWFGFLLTGCRQGAACRWTGSCAPVIRMSMRWAIAPRWQAST